MLNYDDRRCTSRPILCAGLMLAILAGCGGEKEPSPKPPSGADSKSVSAATSTMKKAAPPAAPDRPAAVSSAGSDRYTRLAALPLLASLSERDKAGLFRQLQGASLSERLTLINQFKSLEGLPDQQKQVLLGQLEEISPVTTPASRLVCNCSNDIKLELCVKESCSNQSEMESMCSRACGTLAAFGHQCTASPQCVSR